MYINCIILTAILVITTINSIPTSTPSPVIILVVDEVTRDIINLVINPHTVPTFNSSTQ